MSQPRVVLATQDGQIGAAPLSAGKPLAVVGVSSGGTVNLPGTYASAKAIRADFGDGPLVEAAATHCRRGGVALVVKANATTAGSNSAVNSTLMTGTSVVTLDPTPTPRDDYEVVVEFVAGGTVGVAGITYRESYDAGRTWSGVKALGTANTFLVAGAAQVDLAAGTIVAGDRFSFASTAPVWNTSDLTNALIALKNSAVDFSDILIAGDMSAAGVDAIEAEITSMFAKGKFVCWHAHTRRQGAAESSAAYAAAMQTEFGAKATITGEIVSGNCVMISAVSGRQYMRTPAFELVSDTALASEEINIADVNRGPYPVGIRDSAGNTIAHDESQNPGLDDQRFTVLRTWEGFGGVYCNRPRLFSPDGSDFYIVPHRRVFNLAMRAMRVYLIRRLNKPILVDKATGFILERVAQEIEAQAMQVLTSTLLAKPKASAVKFVLSRTDNILVSKTLTVLQIGVTPLAYPEIIEADIGFFNPALQVLAV